MSDNDSSSSVEEVIPATFGPWQNVWWWDLQHAQLKNNDVWEKSTTMEKLTPACL
jgi:hypothetical protein